VIVSCSGDILRLMKDEFLRKAGLSYFSPVPSVSSMTVVRAAVGDIELLQLSSDMQTSSHLIFTSSTYPFLAHSLK
jgi:hypothetical protein